MVEIALLQQIVDSSLGLHHPVHVSIHSCVFVPAEVDDLFDSLLYLCLPGVIDRTATGFVVVLLGHFGTWRRVYVAIAGERGSMRVASIAFLRVSSVVPLKLVVVGWAGK